jgi:hypothetical protein
MNANAEVLERIERRSRDAETLRNFWERTMPTADLPMLDQFYVWVRQHTLDTMLFAIDKTARKRATLHGKMDIDYTVKYCSKCANNFQQSKERAA